MNGPFGSRQTQVSLRLFRRRLPPERAVSGVTPSLLQVPVGSLLVGVPCRQGSCVGEGPTRDLKAEGEAVVIESHGDGSEGQKGGIGCVEPAMISSIAAQSQTVRAIGPTWS